MAIASLIIVIVDFETVEGIQFDGFVATFYETADRLVKLPIFKKVNGTFTYFYVFFFSLFTNTDYKLTSTQSNIFRRGAQVRYELSVLIGIQ